MNKRINFQIQYNQTENFYTTPECKSSFIFLYFLNPKVNFQIQNFLTFITKENGEYFHKSLKQYEFKFCASIFH